MSWRHDIMPWRHKTWLTYFSLNTDVLEKWSFSGVSVTEFENAIFQCCEAKTLSHDVTKPDIPISACSCARKFIFLGFHVSRVAELNLLTIFYLYDVVMSQCFIQTA